jgi:hypothetical protein
MEPNASFFLAGRYGDPEDPFAVVTEYRKQTFNVVPTLPEIVEHMRRAGFALWDYRHPSHRRAGAPDGAYTNNFAIWDFMVFVAVGPLSDTADVRGLGTTNPKESRPSLREEGR